MFLMLGCVRAPGQQLSLVRQDDARPKLCRGCETSNTCKRFANCFHHDMIFFAFKRTFFSSTNKMVLSRPNSTFGSPAAFYAGFSPTWESQVWYQQSQRLYQLVHSRYPFRSNSTMGNPKLRISMTPPSLWICRKSHHLVDPPLGSVLTDTH